MNRRKFMEIFGAVTGGELSGIVTNSADAWLTAI